MTRDRDKTYDQDQGSGSKATKKEEMNEERRLFTGDLEFQITI